eukprot:4694983-Alexandrium_andersonii.AAC.1
MSALPSTQTSGFYDSLPWVRMLLRGDVGGLESLSVDDQAAARRCVVFYIEERVMSSKQYQEFDANDEAEMGIRMARLQQWRAQM